MAINFVVALFISPLALVAGNSTKPANFTSSGVRKPFTLTILSYITKTGQEPYNGVVCEAAMQVVADHVNGRTDILPDYNIEFVMADEGKVSYAAPRVLMGYLNTAEQRPNYFVSPIVIGPDMTCSNVDSVLRQYHMTEISRNCNGPAVTGEGLRQLHWNLYRLRSPIVNQYMAALAFILKATPWRRIALVVSPSTSTEMKLGTILQQIIIASHIQVPVFIGANELNADTLAPLKQGRVRIIALQTSQLDTCIKFFCSAYQLGLRPPYYAFFAYFYCASNDLILRGYNYPEGCSLSVLYEMYKHTFFSGSYQGALENVGPSTFGYDRDAFDVALKQKLNGTPPLDWEQRTLCQDSAMAPIIALDKSEATLRSLYNRTLSDFQSDPKLVGQVVGKSVSYLEFTGLRIGKIKFSKPREELDEEGMYIAQRINSTIRPIYKVTPINVQTNEDVFNISKYELALLNEPLWTTKSGQPPKDQSEVKNVTSSYPAIGLYVWLCIAGVLSLIQLVGASLIWSHRSDHFRIYFNASSNLVLLVGCLVLNSTIVCLIAGDIYFPATTCYLRYVLILFGTSLCNGVLFTRVFSLLPLMNYFSWRMRFRKIDVPSRRKRTKQSLNLSLQFSNSKVRIVSMLGIATLLLINVVALAIWLLGIDQMDLLFVTSDAKFNEEIDSYYNVTLHYCYSKYQFQWTVGFAVYHSFLLLSAIYIVLKFQRPSIPKTFRLELTVLRWSLSNAVTIYHAVAFFLTLIYILPVPLQGAFVELHILTIGLLLYSVSLSVVMLHHVWASKWWKITC